MAIEELLDNMEESMMNAEDAMKTDIAAIRTGKASTALVEGLMVEYYGTNTRLRDIAGLSTPDARTVAIQPWDLVLTARPAQRRDTLHNSISEFLRSATARLCVCRFRR